MKSIMTKINLLMGAGISFVLSLAGILLSRHFSLTGWAVSFGI